MYRPWFEKLTLPLSTFTALISSTIYSTSASSSLLVTVPKLKLGSVPALKEPLVAIISQSGLVLAFANVYVHVPAPGSVTSLEFKLPPTKPIFALPSF